MAHGHHTSHIVAPEDAVKAQDLQHGGKGLGVLFQASTFLGGSHGKTCRI